MDSLFNRSKMEKIKLELIYMNKEGAVSQRTVRIVGIQDLYVTAYCYERKQVRTFMKENILSVLPKSYLGNRYGA